MNDTSEPMRTQFKNRFFSLGSLKNTLSAGAQQAQIKSSKEAHQSIARSLTAVSLLPLAACGSDSDDPTPQPPADKLVTQAFAVVETSPGLWQVASNFGAVDITRSEANQGQATFTAAQSSTAATAALEAITQLQVDSATSLDVAIADQQTGAGFKLIGSGDVTFTSAALRDGFEDNTSALLNVELTGGDLMFDLPSDDNDTLTLLTGSTITLNGGRLIIDDGTVDASAAIVSGVTRSDGIVLNSKLVLTASQAKELTDAGVSITRGETDDPIEAEEVSVVEIIVKSAEDIEALEELASGNGERLGLLVAQNTRGETPNLAIAVDQQFEQAEENANAVERVFEVLETKKEVIEQATGRSEANGTLTLPKRGNNGSSDEDTETGGGTTSTTPATPSGPTAQEIANSKAEGIGGFDGTGDAPTGQDYEDAGIPGAGDWGKEVAEAVNEAIAGKAGKGSGQGGKLTAEEVRDTAKAVEKINEAGGAGKDSPTAEDYEDAGVTGVTEGNVDGVNEIVENSSDKGLTPTELQGIVDALNKINAYDGTNVAPTIADYRTVDVANVTEALLGAMNARVAASANDNLKPSDLTTIIGEIAAASTKINGYTGTGAAPVTADYEALSITGVTAENVAAVNAMIAGDAKADKTPEELQTLASQAADISARINAYAGGSERAPSLLDYSDIGITGASDAADLAVLNAAVAASSDDNLTPAELQTLADAAFAAADKIEAYDGTNSAPAAEDYALLGITGIGTGSGQVDLATVNGEVANKASYTPDIIQTLVNKANTAISKIQGYAGGIEQVPTEADYDALLADDTLVTSSNVDLVNAAIAANGTTTIDAAGVETIAKDAIASAGVINAYAADATNTAPSQSDYDNLGITGVTTADTLAAANAGLADYSITALSVAHMQTRVDEALQSQSTINLYAGGGIFAPTQADYTTLGVSGIDNATKLGYVNAAVAEARDDSLVPSEMQTIADAAIKLNLFDGQTAVPTPADYLALGVGGVTTATINAVNAALADSTDALLTPTEIQAIVAESALTIISVTAPSAGGYVTGDTLTFTVNTSNPTSVNTSDGTPRLELTIGSNTEYATFVSGSGTTGLTFSYTVKANDADSDGIEVNSLAANGGTLKDAAGNNLNTTLSAISDTSAVFIDTQAPTATMSAGQVASATGTITVQSNEVGTAYLVESSETVTTVAEITALADAKFNSAPITAANTDTQIAVSGLGSGTYKLYVADAAGNLSAGTAQTATLDTTAPAAPASLLEPDTSILADGYWNDSEASATLRVSLPTSGELAVAGDTVELLLDSGSFATAKTATLGAGDITNGYVDFTVAKADMGSDGSKTLTATITDAAGNTSSASSGLTTNLDTTAPTTPTVDSLTASTLTPTITGTAPIGTGESLTVIVGGATYDEVAVNGGTWSIDLSTASADSGTLSLADGNTYDVQATVTDAAGNSSDDTSTDELSVIMIKQVIDLGSGKGQLISPYQLNDNGTTRVFYVWDADNDGNIDGDDAINSGELASLTGVFGTAPLKGFYTFNSTTFQVPTLTTMQDIATDSGSGMPAANWFNIRYYYEMDAFVKNTSGHYQGIGLTDGTLGHTSTGLAYVFEVDPFIPVAPNLTQNGSELTATGEAGATLTLFDGSTDITTKFNIVENSGTYFATAKAGEFDGTETLSITAILTDAFGNESEASSAVTGAIDTTGPGVESVTFSKPADNFFTTDDTIEISAKFEDDVTVNASNSKLLLEIDDNDAASPDTAEASFSSFDADSNTIIYQYIVQPGDLDADGITATEITLANGETITGGGLAADLTFTSISDSDAVVNVIDLGEGRGNLIEPISMNGSTFFFWDKNGDGVSDTNDRADLADAISAGVIGNNFVGSFAGSSSEDYKIPSATTLEAVFGGGNSDIKNAFVDEYSLWQANDIYYSQTESSSAGKYKAYKLYSDTSYSYAADSSPSTQQLAIIVELL
ncbi:beta strand repeat-containing protein [Yoonia vestfoldensis]|uniref:Uncharacterized protein n=1 Tax=Yoonia vestfoldensis TaxID=245188 RepID=A0A1Y0E9N3_9RHOB|nr:hypothetical protein [Yoonia vestfoldensis]ARU00071.1 hypothetical protein LOKVESSMR4R_00736 [Yoonia vestfoldensis]